MRLSNITFYSTPLDIEHSRIIDVIGDEETDYITSYNEALFNYEYLDVYSLTRVRALKMVNKRAELVVNIDYFTAIKYNYCRVNIDKYFFIEKVTSLNDNVDNPSCSITLLWDYWANNLTSLMKDNKTFTEVNRRHINRFYKENNNYKPLFYTNSDVELNSYKEPFNDTYNILFLRILLNENLYDVNNSPFDNSFSYEYRQIASDNYISGIATNSPLSYIPQKTNSNVLYIPITVIKNYNTIDNSWYLQAQCNINPINRNGLYNLRQTVNMTKYRLNVDQFELVVNDSKKIISAELTFNSPLDYFYDIETKTITFNSPIIKITGNDLIIPLLKGYDTRDYNFRAFAVPVSVDIPNDSLTLTVNNYNTLGSEKIIDIDYIDEFIPTITNVSNTISENINDNDNYYDPKLLQYPYNYVKVVYGSDEHIITPINLKTSIMSIIIDNNTLTPFIRFKDNNGFISIVNSAIENTGGLSFTTRALDEFLNRGGASYKTSLILDKINVGMNIFNKIGQSRSLKSLAVNTVSGMARGTLDLLSIDMQEDAKMSDLSKNYDIVVNSPYSEYDYFNQDLVKIFRVRCVDNLSLDIAKKELYTYGYKIATLDNPFNNYRVWFDYVQTSNCNIIQNINEEDKKEIQNMFNRGVHKFHYHTDGTFNSNLSLSPIGHNNIELQFKNIGG